MTEDIIISQTIDESKAVGTALNPSDAAHRSIALEKLRVVDQPLQERHRWICWRWKKDKNGKPTKVPISPVTLKPISTQDESEWESYEQALEDAPKNDGVGYVLGDGIGGVDLDNCRNPDTGEITPWANTIIARFPSLYPRRNSHFHGIKRRKTSND